MILGNLRLLARAIIPGCKTDVVSDTLLDLILNEGAKDISAYTACLPTNKKFSAVASQGDASNPYLISSVIGNFLTMGKGGLHWNQGTVLAPDYKRLDPRTVAWLDANRPNWKDVSDGTPQEYSISGDNLYIIPAPSSALSNSFWLFYSKIPSDMTAPTHYAFSGSTTLLSHLEIFNMVIIKYAKWIISPMIGQASDANIARDEYIKLREEKYSLYKKRPDISNDMANAWKGVVI